MNAQAEFGYWGEHPEYPVECWKYQVANGNTRCGYWEWVERAVEESNDGGGAEEDDEPR